MSDHRPPPGDDIPPPRPPLRLVPKDAQPPHADPPKQPHRKRSSKTELQRRIEYAETMEVNGFQTHRILWSLQKEFSVTERQAQKYLQRARALIQAHHARPADEKRVYWEALIMNNYREAIRTGDIMSANKSVELLMKINGIGGIADIFGQLLKRVGDGPLDPKMVDGFHRLRDRFMKQAVKGDPQALEHAQLITNQMVRHGLALDEQSDPRGGKKAYAVLEASPDCPAWPGNTPVAAPPPTDEGMPESEEVPTLTDDDSPSSDSEDTPSLEELAALVGVADDPA